MSTPTTTPTTTTTTTDLVESVGLFLEWCYYLFLPIVLVVGTFCFAKTVIKATKFYEGKERLDGKTIVITGGSNGLGRALAVELCRRGARVISACRTRLRRDSTAVYLREKTGSFNHRVMYMDLNNLESVRNFARELVDTEERVDCLINNAGIICDRDFTADGIDRMMGINYVGHFLLTNLLCEKIMTTPNGLGKVISITGGSFNRGSLDDLRDLEAKKKTSYDLRAVYRSSKLGLYVMNRELARRFTHFDICSLCVDPGLMSTDFYRNLPAPQNQLWSLIAKCMFRSPEEGMQSVLHALLAQDIKECSGMVIKDCEVYTPTGCNWTDAVIEDLWTQTLELLRNKGFEVELGVSEEVDLGTVSSGVDAAQLDLQRLARLAKRSVTDDEEEGPQLPPRPATPPRSNKTHLDEGNEMVETVEFHAEEPAEVVRTTPSRQGSVEKDKTKDKTVVRQKSDVEVLGEILQGGEASGGLLRVNANVPRGPTPTLESLADETTPDINTLKKMLDEEETADLRKIEEMLRAEGTSVDDVLSAEDYDLEGQDERDDILKVEKMLRAEEEGQLAEEIEEEEAEEEEEEEDEEGTEEEKADYEPSPTVFATAAVTDPDVQALGDDSLELSTAAALATGPVGQSSEPSGSLIAGPHDEGTKSPNYNLKGSTEAQAPTPESSTESPVKDLPMFEFNYDRRNSQMHNSITDVKTRGLLLYPGKKRINLL